MWMGRRCRQKGEAADGSRQVWGTRPRVDEIDLPEGEGQAGSRDEAGPSKRSIARGRMVAGKIKSRSPGKRCSNDDWSLWHLPPASQPACHFWALWAVLWTYALYTDLEGAQSDETLTGAEGTLERVLKMKLPGPLLPAVRWWSLY